MPMAKVFQEAKAPLEVTANTKAGDLMTAVLVEIGPSRTAIKEDPEAVVLVEDVDALTADALPGCNDDNPYN